jgi:hypothetical protein
MAMVSTSLCTKNSDARQFLLKKILEHRDLVIVLPFQQCEFREQVHQCIRLSFCILLFNQKNWLPSFGIKPYNAAAYLPHAFAARRLILAAPLS